MTAQDLASYSSEWVEPLSIDYRGWRVYELPPNGQGMAALEMLNIMETSPASPLGAFGAPEMHKRIEAMKLAYSDVHANVADPRVHDAPVAQLLSKEYARKRAALIDPNRANCEVKAGDPVGSNTTYLTVVDKDGNIASWIQSLYSAFGSRVTVEGMGFALQNRGASFTSRSQASQRAGRRQAAVSHHHSGLHGEGRRSHRLRHHGRRGAADGPRAVRFQLRRLRHDLAGSAGSAAFLQEQRAGLRCLHRIARAGTTLQQLSERGHEIRIGREYVETMGRGQAILHNSKTGMNYAASDPRADGAAIPEPLTEPRAVREVGVGRF